MSSAFLFPQKCVPFFPRLLCGVRMLCVLLLPRVFETWWPSLCHTRIRSFCHSPFLCFLLPSTAMCHAAETHVSHLWTSVDNYLLMLASRFINISIRTKRLLFLRFSPVRNDSTSPPPQPYHFTAMSVLEDDFIMKLPSFIP